MALTCVLIGCIMFGKTRIRACFTGCQQNIKEKVIEPRSTDFRLPISELPIPIAALAIERDCGSWHFQFEAKRQLGRPPFWIVALQNLRLW